MKRQTSRVLGLLLLLATGCQQPPPAADRPDSAATGGVATVTVPVATADTQRAADGPTPLTANGWGPLRIGMTRAEVVAAAGEDANPAAVGGPDPAQCDEFRPARAPAGMLVMIESGKLTRITLMRDSPVKTDRGFGVGSSAADIKAAYGAAATSGLHKYVDPPAEYITYWESGTGAGRRGIKYEIGREGRATHVHAGGPSIEYVEGCL